MKRHTHPAAAVVVEFAADGSYEVPCADPRRAAYAHMARQLIGNPRLGYRTEYHVNTKNVTTMVVAHIDGQCSVRFVLES
jgi:hypothetical protein